MDYDGLLPKFPVNRPLGDWELSHRLRQGKPARVVPWQQFSLIRMNSTYLECVDKFFEARGMLTAAGLFCVAISLGMLAIPIDIVFRMLTMPPEDQRGGVLLMAFGLLLFVPTLYFCLRFMFFKEAFRYTHYPMRFNRKNRMVYVTRFDGTVMAEPWDRLFFALGDIGKGAHDIRMHRLHTPSGALGFLVLPVDLIYTVGRWLANITSKIPRWPEEVERECRIAPDDPYIRDRDNLATQAEYWAAQDRREEERSRL